MVGDYEVFNYLFSLKNGDVVFTTADVGCITFSRIMYGTLMHVREVNVHGRSPRLP